MCLFFLSPAFVCACCFVCRYRKRKWKKSKRSVWSGAGGRGVRQGGRGWDRGRWTGGRGSALLACAVLQKKKTVPATLDILPLVLSSSASCRLLGSCYSWVPATLLRPQARQAPMHLYFPPHRIRPFKCCLLNRAA